jgi:putative SbcD/Mre11-related phosphoesterase
MPVSFLENAPALLVEEERLLVVGDLHIGTEFKMRDAGMIFPNASRKMAEDVLALYKKAKARGIVLLGDVKDSIAYPGKDEYGAITEFFAVLRGVKTIVVKGNHDAHLAEILKRIQVDAEVVNELMLSKTALIHGNALPSEEAMAKEYIVTAHSHIAAEVNERTEKAWLIATPGRNVGKRYEKYNKKIRLVVMPAFSDLIVGLRVTRDIEWHMPLLKNKIFDPDKAVLYDLSGEKLGMVSSR